ncbi:MAG: hypothetical protein WC809_12280 [Sinimarinibacterium sp.]|jgi:hypothetical protein
MSKPADLIRRRKALHLGLIGTLDEAQAQIGLRLWDASFAEQKPAAIIEFVAQLSAQLALPPKQRHEMRMGIYQALLKYDAGREPIPEVNGARPPHAMAVMAPSMPETAPAWVSGTPQFVVFSTLLQHLLDALRIMEAVARHDLIQSLRGSTGRSGLDFGLHHALTQWIKEGASLSAFATATEDALALAVHTLYVAFCEAVGPVAADQLLARAVRVADALPEAARFPPRRLL